jgi:hypothetical protein
VKQDRDSLSQGNPGKLRVKDFMELDGTSAYKTVLFIQKVDEVLYVRNTMTEEYFMHCILPLRLSGAAESIGITDGGSSSSWNEW